MTNIHFERLLQKLLCGLPDWAAFTLCLVQRGTREVITRLSGLGPSFNHLDDRPGFGIDPSDWRSRAKRTIQQPLAYLANFLRALRLVDRLLNPMPLTGVVLNIFVGGVMPF